ncbi:MAG: methyltransferase [Pseudomonadota bacterium]
MNSARITTPSLARSSLCLLVASLLGCASAWADVAALEQAVAGDQRTPSYAARDAYRNPVQTLALFDVQPYHTVVEIWPGGGWYTEILAPYLRTRGKLIAAHYDASDTQASYRPRAREAFERKLAANKRVYDQVEIASLMFDEAEKSLTISAAPSGSADRILTFRNTHGWRARGLEHVAFEHFFDVLKPGGKLGVVQHMADEDQDWMSRNIGYLGRDYVIAVATAAGFELEAEGFFNLNPLDTKRHENGVWQLPPNLRGLESDAEKDRHRAIGESERMTLLFVKPE